MVSIVAVPLYIPLAVYSGSIFLPFVIFCLKKNLEDFVYLFLERGRVRDERERNDVWLPFARPLLGTWPATQPCILDWESNQGPFDSQAGTQSTEPHQPGLIFCFVCLFVFDTSHSNRFNSAVFMFIFTAASPEPR